MIGCKTFIDSLTKEIADRLFYKSERTCWPDEILAFKQLSV